MADREWLDKKLTAVLNGVLISELTEGDEVVIRYNRLNSPPSYLIKMVLMWLKKESLDDGGHKSDWKVTIMFNKRKWFLEDLRGRTWFIYGEVESEDAAEILLKKLIKAADIMNTFTSERAIHEIEQNNFMLENHFHKIQSMYSMFVFETNQLILEKQHDYTEKSISLMFNKRWQYQKKLEANVTAAVFFFFAMSEIILDCCYSLGERHNIKYSTFRNLSWNERFKSYFPVGRGEFGEVFREVLKIKDEYRNAFAHAEPIYFLPIEEVGWVPRDVNDLYRPIMAKVSPISSTEAQSIFGIFDKLMELIKCDDLGQYVYLYAESGLPILINEDHVRPLKRHMTSIEEFTDEVVQRCNYQDALANWDI